jgi:beta-lactamase regulating signal transducer with metallopeptidase domain
MNALYHSPFLYALGWAIASSFWQMALLWIIYQLCFSVQSRIKPFLKHLAATGFLMAGFVWFCISLLQKYMEQESLQQYIASLPALNDTSGTNAPATFFSATGWNNILATADQYLPYISAAYLLVLLFLAFRLVNAYLYSQQLRTTGLLPVEACWKNLVEKYSQRIGIGRGVRIYLSEWIDVPATLGYLKPVILLPLATFNHLSMGQVEAILLHELSHIRRNDYLINIMVSVIETILFFNPFANLLAGSLKKERENCCDDFVLQFHCDPHSYAAALLSLEKLRMNSSQLAIAATGSKNQLLGRVKRIMNVKTRNFNYGQKLMALIAIAFILTSMAWLAPSGSTKPSYSKAGSRIETDLNTVTSERPKSAFITEKKADARDHKLYPLKSKIDRSPNDLLFAENDSVPESDLVNDQAYWKFMTPDPQLPARPEISGLPVQESMAQTLPLMPAPTNQDFNWNIRIPEEYFSYQNFDQLLPQIFYKNPKDGSRKVELNHWKQAFENIDWKKMEQEWKQDGQTQDWQTLERQLKDEFESQLKRIDVENVLSPLALTVSIGENPSPENEASSETALNSGDVNIATPSSSRIITTRLNRQILNYLVNTISNQKAKTTSRIMQVKGFKQLKEPANIMIKSDRDKQREVQKFSFEYKTAETRSLAPMIITLDENCNQNLTKVKGIKVFGTDMTPANHSKVKENWDQYYRDKKNRDHAARVTKSSVQGKNLTLTSDDDNDEDQD